MLDPGCRGFRTSFLFAIALGVAALFGADRAKDADEQRVEDLIRQLRDEEYANRELANAELKAVGEKALPPLRAALNTSPDPEVRFRVHRAIREILRGLGTSKSTGLRMVPLSYGEFQMGSPKNDGYRRPDEQSHKVRLTRSFLIGVHEVTQGQYLKVMNTNPSWFSATGGGKDKIARMDTTDFPVENVTWFDALDFCNRLSKLDGFPTHYTLTDVKTANGSITSATVKVAGGNGYRLPTEAEWEYACRAGSSLPFHFGHMRNGDEANYRVHIGGGYGGSERTVFLGRTAKAGSYKANDWTLCDMHGNVGEWCWDLYDKDYYEKSPVDDPTGPAAGGHRVVRGGSWMVNFSSCRSATRFSLAPDERKDTAGFRVARTP